MQQRGSEGPGVPCQCGGPCASAAQSSGCGAGNASGSAGRRDEEGGQAAKTPQGLQLLDVHDKLVLYENQGRVQAESQAKAEAKAHAPQKARAWTAAAEERKG
jgi:hypothetical protein